MYSMFGVLLAAMLSLSTVVAGADGISREYHFSAVFAEDDYILHWEVDMQTKVIVFSVNVSTTGWVGFGLSPTGQMPGSDVVIGWVDNYGLVKFHVSKRDLSKIIDKYCIRNKSFGPCREFGLLLGGSPSSILCT